MTTRRLVLIRHSKAAAGSTDIERPLAHRGVADAAAVGRWLASQRIEPDLVVVSPAFRAAQTWQIAAKASGIAAEIAIDNRIYDNTVNDLLDIVQETVADVVTLVLVGHNPSIGELAVRLDDGSGAAPYRRALLDGYPTSGVAVFEIPTEWLSVDVGAATVVGFAVLRG
jgi:phosphohistidine phosphatase